jgi:signal transduction histidine kinase
MPPELAEMAHSFNAMLGRLDDAFQRLSAFSADIAHELRTPLSNLLTHTQVTLTRPRRSRITAKRCTATSKNCNGWRSWSTTCCTWPKPTMVC